MEKDAEQSTAEAVRSLEGRLLEAVQHITKGREEAHSDLEDEAQSVENGELRKEIDDRADQGEKLLVDLQQRIGELNYMLGDPNVSETAESVKSLTGRIQAETASAVREFSALVREDESLPLESDALRQIWYRFSLRVVLGITHLAEAMDTAAEDLAEQRRKLLRELGALDGAPSREAGDSEESGDGLHRLHLWAEDWLKALVMHPDKAVPRVDERSVGGNQKGEAAQEAPSTGW